MFKSTALEVIKPFFYFKDLDEYPDNQLDCKMRKCKRDNCPKIANSGKHVNKL